MSKFTIFHFNCPICGSHPVEEDIEIFLKGWFLEPPKSKAEHMFAIFIQILEAISHREWLSSEYSRVIKEEIELIMRVYDTKNSNRQSSPLLYRDANKNIIASFDCPFCNTNKGPREKDKYFKEWELADSVQIANFLYEGGIAIFAIGRSLPSWATPEHLRVFRKILKLNRQSQEALGLMECPFCRRFTTCLYGEGTEDNPHRCRWCLDRAGGGAGIAISFSAKKDFDDDFTDHLEEYLSGCIDDQELKMHIKDHLNFETNKGIPKDEVPDEIVPKP